MKIIKEIGHKTSSDGRVYRFAIFECKSCKKHIEKIKKDGIKANFCSHKCYAKNRAKRGAYKRKVIISKYYYIYTPNHPHAIGTKKLYVAEHRLVMEKHLGRFLTKDEVVHHKDEDTLNNNIENLQLMSASEHIKIHKLNSKRKNNVQFTI
ncbi:MAG TPA: HNH endonuclease signature motif containing protein [Bacteroidia bacterium]|nr:HNH endonuclease signature motif containing protein [Bacteroidia bacterium]